MAPPNQHKTTMTTYGLKFLNAGYPALPCRIFWNASEGKRSGFPEWKAATLDTAKARWAKLDEPEPEQAESDEQPIRRNKTNNINTFAIPSGKKSGIFLVDFDNKDEDGKLNGMMWLAEQEAIHGKIDTFELHTA